MVPLSHFRKQEIIKGLLVSQLEEKGGRDTGGGGGGGHLTSLLGHEGLAQHSDSPSPPGSWSSWGPTLVEDKGHPISPHLPGGDPPAGPSIGELQSRAGSRRSSSPVRASTHEPKACTKPTSEKIRAGRFSKLPSLSPWEILSRPRR